MIKENELFVKEIIIMTKSAGFKFNVIQFLFFIAGFILVWIFFDFLYSSFISQNGFMFSVANDILKPLIFAVPISSFTQLLHMD